MRKNVFLLLVGVLTLILCFYPLLAKADDGGGTTLKKIGMAFVKFQCPELGGEQAKTDIENMFTTEGKLKKDILKEWRILLSCHGLGISIEPKDGIFIDGEYNVAPQINLRVFEVKNGYITSSGYVIVKGRDGIFCEEFPLKMKLSSLKLFPD